jgi:predicted transcriptional regulator
MTELDLTPFGFTPTETAAYAALLKAGPSSGYAIAKQLSVARANAYDALNGLVRKEAAHVAGDAPAMYRAVQPQAVLARIVRDTSASLAALERQIDMLSPAAEPGTVPFVGSAEFSGILLRLAVREPGPVQLLASTRDLADTLPVWRARAAHERPSEIWCVGAAPADFPVELAGSLDVGRVREILGEELTIALTSSAAVLARPASSGPTGFWTSDPTLVSCARGAFRAATH